MKRIFHLLIFISLIALLLPCAAFANINQTTSNDLTLAQNAAQTWLNHIVVLAEDEIPQWQKTSITSYQVCRDLDGDINAYLFKINNGQDGYILIGSSSYNYDMLQAGTKPPFSEADTENIEQIINADTAQKSEIQISKPIDFIYTGIDGFYNVYEVENQKIAFNLVSQTASPLSKLNLNMPTPEEYQALKETSGMQSQNSAKTLYYNTLNMSYWNGTDPAWCGPCSGVSIGAYYRDYLGYSNLPSSNAVMYNDLYYSMNTWQNAGATLPTAYALGFVEMTENYGYYNIEASLDLFVGGLDDYWAIVDDIDNGWPTALEITTEFHWRAIKGYHADIELWGQWYDVICTNSATGDSFEFLNWLDLDPDAETEMNYTVSIVES